MPTITAGKRIENSVMSIMHAERKRVRRKNYQDIKDSPFILNGIVTFRELTNFWGTSFRTSIIFRDEII